MSQPDQNRPEALSGQNTNSRSLLVRELHELYCHWTAQTLSLRFVRERLLYESFRAGFSAADLKRVVTYLQTSGAYLSVTRETGRPNTFFLNEIL